MVTIQGQPRAQAQDNEVECQIMDAPHIGEGWQRKVCSNSDYDSWIRPDGTECFANEVAGTTGCGELGPENPPLQVQ